MTDYLIPVLTIYINHLDLQVHSSTKMRSSILVALVAVIAMAVSVASHPIVSTL